MMKIGNIIVGQSGGPTAVINASLAGVFKTAKELGAKNVYGMVHGIEGLLNGRYVNMSEHVKSEMDIELLKRTPSAYLGSCRYCMPSVEKDEAVYKKVFEILKKLDIEIFLYIGGNDSMDSIQKLSGYAAKIGSKIRFMGVPKTIDNDLAEIDHTPGFGSAAKYIGTTMKEII
ncbi:MAG: 6-phosphofructokinase, partial [Firmicutes bacterium]|nr:6-phosphofructokinase [Bacillota bacterium]